MQPITRPDAIGAFLWIVLAIALALQTRATSAPNLSPLEPDTCRAVPHHPERVCCLPGGAAGPPLTPHQRYLLGLPMDFNRATADELALLNGIGARTAQKIVAEREEHGPYDSLAALKRVHGIGEKTLARIAGDVLPLPISEGTPRQGGGVRTASTR